MKSTIDMFGIKIDLGEVPDRKKRKYKKRRGVKSLSAPPKNRMVESPIKAKGEPLL